MFFHGFLNDKQLLLAYCGENFLRPISNVIQSDTFFSDSLKDSKIRNRKIFLWPVGYLVYQEKLSNLRLSVSWSLYMT